jgi:integrase
MEDPMGVYRRAGSKVWYMRLRDEHGREIRRSTGCTSKPLAEMKLTKERLAIEERSVGLSSPSPLLTAGEIKPLIEAFVAEMRRDQLSGVYVANTRRFLHRARKSCRWMRPRDITPEQVRRFIECDLAALARPTREGYLLAIRLFCQWLMELTPPALSFNPATGIMPRQRGRAGRETARIRRRPLGEAEIVALLKLGPPLDLRSARTWEHRLLVYETVLYSGLRRREMRMLPKSCLHLASANPFIEVPATIAKSGRARTIPLRDRVLVADLRRHVDQLPAGDRYPFKPIPDVATLHKDLKRAGIDATDEEGRVVDFHALRMTYCTRMALAGVPIRVAQELMGHQDIHTTIRHYTLVGVNDMAENLDRLPSLASSEPVKASQAAG